MKMTTALALIAPWAAVALIAIFADALLALFVAILAVPANMVAAEVLQ